MKEYVKNKLQKYPSLFSAISRLKNCRPFAEHSPRAYDAEGYYSVPEPSLFTLKIPDYIDTILDVGSGAGRNLIPFDGKLKLWATDIVPHKRMKWVRNFKNLTYEKATLRDLTKNSGKKT